MLVSEQYRSSKGAADSPRSEAADVDLESIKDRLKWEGDGATPSPFDPLQSAPPVLAGRAFRNCGYRRKSSGLYNLNDCGGAG